MAKIVDKLDFFLLNREKIKSEKSRSDCSTTWAGEIPDCNIENDETRRGLVDPDSGEIVRLDPIYHNQNTNKIRPQHREPIESHCWEILCDRKEDMDSLLLDYLSRPQKNYGTGKGSSFDTDHSLNSSWYNKSNTDSINVLLNLDSTLSPNNSDLVHSYLRFALFMLFVSFVIFVGVFSGGFVVKYLLGGS